MIESPAFDAAPRRRGRELVVPRVAGSGVAFPDEDYTQEAMFRSLCQYLYGDDWRTRPDLSDDIRSIERLFAAGQVAHRQLAVNIFDRYHREETWTTGSRMVEYEHLAYPLALQAMEGALSAAAQPPASITDLIVVSCTGYSAPGLDVKLAHGLGMPPSVRKTVIGHMGCFAAFVGLRTALGALHAYPGARVAMLCVELCSLHGSRSTDMNVVVGNVLFGDAAAALILEGDGAAVGPEIVDTYCFADFSAQGQMTWNITDDGFLMWLSRRIPVTLGRAVGSAVEQLLAPHGLRTENIQHWLIHPGGPDILEVVAAKLGLSAEQMAPSWQILHDHGNCSSATILLILHELLKGNSPRRGEWGVMMAFGPGLTLETCLLRF